MNRLPQVGDCVTYISGLPRDISYGLVIGVEDGRCQIYDLIYSFECSWRPSEVSGYGYCWVSTDRDLASLVSVRDPETGEYHSTTIRNLYETEKKARYEDTN